MSTLFGWSQSYPNWTVSKNNSDTIITYNFTKMQFTNLRVYIVGLERDRELYIIETQRSELKDSVIMGLFTEVSIKDSIRLIQEKKIFYLDNWGKVQEVEKIKFQKQARAWPYWLGGGFISGVILCLLIK